MLHLDFGIYLESEGSIVFICSSGDLMFENIELKIILGGIIAIEILVPTIIILWARHLKGV